MAAKVQSYVPDSVSPSTRIRPLARTPTARSRSRASPISIELSPRSRAADLGAVPDSFTDSFADSVAYQPRGRFATTSTFAGDDERGQRGRDPSPKNLPHLNDRSPPPPASLPAIAGRRISAATLAAPAFQAHHQPPPAVAAAPHDDPILYLPPLLSRVPHGHGHDECDLDHEFDTRLPDIDPASLALHQALHYFHPLDGKYAQTSYDAAFNWEDLGLPLEVEREWYGVVFRSRRRPESSSLSLYAADRAAHAEAVQNGGLVMYWYGVPDDTGLNLATCIWQSRRHAIKAISGPKHIDAMKQARGAYETYDLERWVITKHAGESGLELRRWEAGDVGW
jgi:hypothetical protein